MASHGMTLPTEVTISLNDATVVEWAIGVGNSNDRPPPPVVIFMADDVHLALRQGLTTWPNRETLEVTPAGYATTTWQQGSAVYELFPAKFDDDQPYEPLVYVGRWPD